MCMMYICKSLWWVLSYGAAQNGSACVRGAIVHRCRCVCYLVAEALLLGVPGFRGAGGGAVQRAAAASCRTKLAAFSKHLRLALGAL